MLPKPVDATLPPDQAGSYPNDTAEDEMVDRSPN